MSDWTSGAATIHACPPHRVRAVLDALEEYGLTDHDAPEEAPDKPPAVINLGKAYRADEFACGSASYLTSDLIHAAPEVAFTVYEEPAYGNVGKTCSYVPDLGLFTADCNASGDPLISLPEVLRLDGEAADVREQQLGVPWRTVIAAMPATTVVEPLGHAQEAQPR